jgi:isopenicillin N synthase-like dioxygenase
VEVLKVDFSEKNAAEMFTHSLKETGFGSLYNHPIDQTLIDDVYAEWTAFFASDYKNNYVFNRNTQDGFFPQAISETAKGYSDKDIKEFFHYYPWGIYPKELSNKTKELYKQMNQMAVTLLQWIQDYSPASVIEQLSMPLSKMIENSQSTLLRVIHYPPFAGGEPEGAVRAAAHGDINLLTVLVGATTSGLQVQDVQGDWHDVPCDKNSIAVNIGDMLEKCTNGAYHSTLHRVINPQGSQNISRLSMPLFLHPRPEIVLSEQYTAGSFLQERLEELGVV